MHIPDNFNVAFFNQPVGEGEVIGKLEKLKNLLIEHYAYTTPSDFVAHKTREFTQNITDQYRSQTINNVFYRALRGNDLITVNRLQQEIFTLLNNYDDANKTAQAFHYQGDNPLLFHQALIKYKLLDVHPVYFFVTVFNKIKDSKELTDPELNELIKYIPQLEFTTYPEMAEEIFNADIREFKTPFYEKLIEQGFGKDFICKDGVPLLLKMMPLNNLKLIKNLILSGANFHCIDPKTGGSLLHIPVFDHHIIEYLLTIGLPVDAKDKEGKTPLHVQAQAGSHQAVSTLLKNKAPVNALDNHHHTPLHYATRKKIQLLVDAGAKLT